MKIRIRHRGEDTKNLCQASFQLPASAEGKEVRVLDVRSPDMPLIPAQTAGFVVTSTIHNFAEMINTPAFGAWTSSWITSISYGWTYLIIAVCLKALRLATSFP